MRNLIDNETGKFTIGQYRGHTIAEVASDGTEGMFNLQCYINEERVDDYSRKLIINWLRDHVERCLQCQYRGEPTILDISLGDWYRCLRSGIVEAHGWCLYWTKAKPQLTFPTFAERHVISQ